MVRKTTENKGLRLRQFWCGGVVVSQYDSGNNPLIIIFIQLQSAVKMPFLHGRTVGLIKYIGITKGKLLT